MARRRQVDPALVRALAERDEALLQLARERELTNALRLQQRSGAEVVPDYPPGTSPGDPPLRYRLADSLNASAKRVLGPVHTAARKLIHRKKRK